MTLGVKRMLKMTKRDMAFYLKLFVSSFLAALVAVIALAGLDDLTKIWNSLPGILIVAIIVSTFVNIMYLKNR